MTSAFGRTPPAWFRIAAVLLTLWGVAGVGAFAADAFMTAETAQALPAYDRQLLAARPGWFLLVYAVATGAALLGSVALLLRRRVALPLYVASLVAVAVQFGWMFAATDIVAVKGGWVAIFPAVIAVVAVAQVAFARLAIRRGWLR